MKKFIAIENRFDHSDWYAMLYKLERERDWKTMLLIEILGEDYILLVETKDTKQ